MKQKQIGSTVSLMMGQLPRLAGCRRFIFHREASSLEEAIGSALGNVKVAGFDAIRVEIELQLPAHKTQAFQTEQPL